ncbi:LacI family transcriptional regulator [Yoonia maricola]|uniref:LacI family transcriptional regulator n=1 Tax=Yoonia maricola TaxID=420999 RepID=A0A2M8WP23_9RHOB|nr:LacI family DNA-binding transcriptional regulator [Yoonia maricola]PJI92663.1 LacI family transcriptional regulator [Yoonia maricola]
MSGPTLSDVADAAGVSYATADRVINKRGNVAQKSIDKVRDAVTRLGYVRNVAAANLSRRRVYRLAFLIPTGSNAFFNRVRDHIVQSANHLSADSISVEIVDVSAFSVEALQNSIGDLADLDFDGVAIVGLQSRLLEHPLAELRARGVAIIGLVSDLPTNFRSAYIGIDNRVAGRTAARMTGIAHAGRVGAIQTFAGSMDARDHAERLQGFRDVITADFPALTVLDPILTKDDPAVLYEAACGALQAGSSVTAVYNVGAGNVGLIKAISKTSGTRPFCVVHELVAHSKQALIDNHINLVIDQRPDVEVNRAFALLRALIDDRAMPPMPDLMPTIYVRDNLPADTLNTVMKAQTT